jgi:hypothetical protein
MPMFALSVTKVAAVFSILSPVTIFVLIPLGISQGGSPLPLDFGKPEELARLHKGMPMTMWIETLALIAPVLALGAGFGWYALLAPTVSYAGFAVGVWYLGMIFVVINDALELGVAARLPAAYEAADDRTRPALLAFGASLSSVIDAFAALGILGHVSTVLIAFAMTQLAGFPHWAGWLGVVGEGLVVVMRIVTALLPEVRAFGPLMSLGFVLYIIWMIVTGYVMWGWPTA